MSKKTFALSAVSGLLLIAAAPQCHAASAQWGAYVSDGNLAQFETLVQSNANIQAVFTGWGTSENFPSQYKPTVADKSKTLLVFWEPSVNYDSILSGKWDSYIASFAASAANYGGPVILAPFHEMNGNWDVWDGTVNGNTPQKMVSAWQYVHKFFSGAQNVKFAWAVNNDSVPNTQANSITSYYPGSAYVDYVGVDGFNFGNPWQSWQSVFSTAINTVKQYGKPIYIFSTASCQGSLKAQWIANLTAGAKQYNLAGWIWFNENKECDWRVNSDANSLAAFRIAVSQAAAPAATSAITVNLPVIATTVPVPASPVATSPAVAATVAPATAYNLSTSRCSSTHSRTDRKSVAYRSSRSYHL